ncbi:hypothetical protein DVQ54_23905 [Yersinia enterocolitica]|nr:hypothetical protein [Yersinia enterocolitica]
MRHQDPLHHCGRPWCCNWARTSVTVRASRLACPRQAKRWWQFVDAVSRVHAIRDHAIKQENEHLGLPD